MNILCRRSYRYLVWLPLVCLLVSLVSRIFSRDYAAGFMLTAIGLLGFIIWYATLSCARQKFCHKSSEYYDLNILTYIIVFLHTSLVFFGFFSPNGDDGFGGFFWMPLHLLDSFSNPIFFGCTTIGCSDAISGFIAYGIVGTVIWFLIGICKGVKITSKGISKKNN